MLEFKSCIVFDRANYSLVFTNTDQEILDVLKNAPVVDMENDGVVGYIHNVELCDNKFIGDILIWSRYDILYSVDGISQEILFENKSSMQNEVHLIEIITYIRKKLLI